MRLARAAFPSSAKSSSPSLFPEGPVIGITGSNGKTTTTALTGTSLKQCGIACQVGGNIGTPSHRWSIPRAMTSGTSSSFRASSLRRSIDFRAAFGACLNVTADHLDRHHTFEIYASAKGRLFETQQAGDFAVLNYDDADLPRICFAPKANVPGSVRRSGRRQASA